MTLAADTNIVTEQLADGLERVERAFEAQLSSTFPAVDTLCRHAERYRGKMLRPTLLLLSGMGTSTGVPAFTEKHVIAAATVEMIHMATLVHDDVLDEASMRRGGATVNFLRGNETAVILGDYLISNAFHLCSRVGDPALNLRLGEVTNALCEGELVQLSRRHDLALDRATYLEIVRRKTAVLVGACCEIGAKLSGASPSVTSACYSIGEKLGIAFQIQDDLLDLTGNEETVGKSIGRDLEKGKLTRPTILSLERESGAARVAVLRAIEARDGDSLKALLLSSGAVESARDFARDIVQKARLELTSLHQPQVRAIFDSLADQVVDRAR